MLRLIEDGSTERLIEIREAINFVNLSIPAAPIRTPKYIDNIKGQVFVQLYGVIEYTISELVKFTLDFINNCHLKLSEIQFSIWSLALSSELDALILSSTKKWDKRNILTNKLKLNSVCEISNILVPTNGKNYDFYQFTSVWKTFSISQPIFHDPSFRGRLSEIIVYRNKIAHGEYLPSSVGSRFTIIELQHRRDEVSRFCSYLISVFDDYLINKKFKI